MLFKTLMKRFWLWFTHLIVVFVWCIGFALMYKAALHEPPIPADGSGQYGQNLVGEFEGNVQLSCIEIGILYLILRPWSLNCRSLWRVIPALLFLLPWTVLLTFAIMHTGSISIAHLCWLYGINLGLIILLILLIGFWTFSESI